METTPPAVAQGPFAYRACPLCNTINPDWLVQCLHCGANLPGTAQAAQAESGHIAYLLSQFPWWRSRNVISPEAESWLQAEYSDRLTHLQSVTAPMDPLHTHMPSPPVLPPVPSDPFASAAVGSSAESEVHPGSREFRTSEVSISTVRDRTASSFPSPPPTSVPTRGIAVFFQDHALKIVFALATVLVLIALRSILGWNETSAAFFALTPLLPLGLTAMFWQFGRKTQAENPWAAFVYQGLTALLVGFDLFLINRFWFAGLGINIPPQPLLLAATTASSTACGLYWRRHRYVAMWHLAQFGILTTLYAVLAVVKLALWRQSGWTPTPLLLFGSAFLGAGAVYFAIAAYYRRNSQAATDERASKPPIPPVAWTLWANMSIGAAFAVSGLALAFGQRLHTDDFLLVLMLAGALYGVVAQALDDARLVYVAAALCLGSSLTWAPAHLPWGALSFSVLFLALSTIAIALCRYNRRYSRRDALSTAWKRVGCTAALLGMVLVSGPTFLALVGTAALAPPLHLLLQAGLAVGFGLQFVYVAVEESDAAFCYPGCLSFGIALTSLLEALHVAPERFPLAVALYAAILILQHRLRRSKPVGSSLPHDRLELGIAGRNCGMVTLVISLATSSVFAVEHNNSGWVLVALILGAMLSGILSGRSAGPEWRYTALYAFALSCALFLHISAPIRLGFADCMLLFVFIANAGAFATSLSRTAPHPPTGSTWQRVSAVWQDPLADAGIVSTTITLFAAWSQVFGSGVQSHFALVATVSTGSSLLLVASRRVARSDTRRVGALVLLNVSAGLGIALGAGLANAGAVAAPEAIHRFALGLFAQGWLFWLLARALYLFSPSECWSEDSAQVALVPPCLAALLTTVNLVRLSPTATFAGVPPVILIAGTMALLHVEQMRVRNAHLVPISLGMMLLAVVCFLNAPTQVQTFPALTLAAFTILATISYLQLAKRMDRVGVIYLGMAPLIGGVALATLRFGNFVVLPADIDFANTTWTLGGATVAWGFLGAARRWKRADLVQIAGVVLVGAYLRAVTWPLHLPSAWDGLLLLPLLLGMAMLSMRPPRGWAMLQPAFVRLAAAMSALALTGTVLIGETGIGATPGRNSDLVTSTLAAYGVAYVALTFRKRSPRTLAVGASVLTLAYLNLLLSRTPVLATGFADLSWPLFSFLFVQAALTWSVIGIALKRLGADKTLTAPIFVLTQAVALASGVSGIWSLFAPAQGALGILTLVWAAGIWFGMWALDQGDLCLHVGTGNLLAVWCATIYHMMGTDVKLLDIYLLPFGIYLMGMGHIVSRRQKGSEAQMFWGLGLLVTLTPALLTRWMHAPGWHAAVLMAECIVCVLWGVAQRIRIFVGIGLGTILLYTASITLGIVPDTFTTILALSAGVGLFVFGFYALTHKETMKRMAAAMQHRWSVWHSWR